MAGNASRVSTVATISPPMMATAIGPQKTERDSGNHRQHGSRCRQHDRPQPPHGALDDRIPGRHAPPRGPARSGRSGSPNCAGSCPSARSRPAAPRNRTAGSNSSRAPATPAMPSGPVRNTSMARLKLCSCSISSVKVMNSMIGTPCRDRRRALAALLHRPGHVDTVTACARRRPAPPGRAGLRQQFGRHGGALQALDDVALHGDRVVAVLAPHHARLPGDRAADQLGHRYRLPRTRRQVGIGRCPWCARSSMRLAQHDVDRLVAFAVLPDRGAAQHGPRRLGDRLAGDSQRPRLGSGRHPGAAP
jgi:hypothetical protein